MNIPQYAKSTDPEVIATIQANDAAFPAFREQVMAFVEKYGRPSIHKYWRGSAYETSEHPAEARVYNRGHNRSLAGLSGGKPTIGRWTDSEGYWRPFKKDPAYKEMLAVTLQSKPVPGLPKYVFSTETRDGASYMMTPAAWLYDGTAYVGLAHAPGGRDPHPNDLYGPQWVEILTSEYYAAREARWPKDRIDG